ncbi:hypothetical protein ACP70R_047798 [Stipagrostis hirtigluma subsp. patula]
MAAGNFHDKSVREKGTTATAHDATGTLDGDLDRLSWLPDDVLLDILGRLDADAVAQDELLVNGHQIETLIFRFDSGKIWVQPETPKELGDALGRLKVLRLKNISPEYDLLWTLCLLEAAPLLETLEIHIFDHICLEKLRKKFSGSAALAWQPSSDFTHRNLKEVSIHRAFNAFKDLQFARHVMELAVNLETLTLGVKSLECEDCRAAEPKLADLARSRSRLTGNNVDAAVRKLKHGISTCAQITILLPD